MMTEQEKRDLIFSLPDWDSFADMETKPSGGNIILPDFKIGFYKKMESKSPIFDLPEIDDAVNVPKPEKEKAKVVHGNIFSNDSEFKPLF
jgi:hypothetical protein